jgi:hypothetical protein
MTQSQSDVHNITLSTPPARLERADTMQNLGLGIANVKFEDRSAAVTPVDKLVKEADSADEDDFDASADEEDSDDEFIPGGRGKAKKRVSGAGKKRKNRGLTMKRPKRLQV